MLLSRIFDAIEKGNNPKRQRLRKGSFSNEGQANCKWFLIVCRRYVTASALILKTKYMHLLQVLRPLEEMIRLIISNGFPVQIFSILKI